MLDNTTAKRRTSKSTHSCGPRSIEGQNFLPQLLKTIDNKKNEYLRNFKTSCFCLRPYDILKKNYTEFSLRFCAILCMCITLLIAMGTVIGQSNSAFPLPVSYFRFCFEISSTVFKRAWKDYYTAYTVTVISPALCTVLQWLSRLKGPVHSDVKDRSSILDTL